MGGRSPAVLGCKKATIRSEPCLLEWLLAEIVMLCPLPELQLHHTAVLPCLVMGLMSPALTPVQPTVPREVPDVYGWGSPWPAWLPRQGSGLTPLGSLCSLQHPNSREQPEGVEQLCLSESQEHPLRWGRSEVKPGTPGSNSGLGSGPVAVDRPGNPRGRDRSIVMGKVWVKLRRQPVSKGPPDLHRMQCNRNYSLWGDKS